MTEQELPVVLRCNALALTRDRRPVLDDVHCDIRPGELTAVIGPNGAGKSSLLSVLAGLLPPSAGEVSLGVRALAGIPVAERARRCAFLPQQEVPAWSMAAQDLVALGLLPWGRAISRTAVRERVARALAQVDATELALRQVTHLSGGELRRVQLARLLVGDAPLLIADEPGAALDIRHQLQLMQTFRQQSDSGKTVVLALHDLGLAARYCDRLLLMQGGRLFAEGTPEQVLTPARVGEVYGIHSEFRWRDGRAEFIAGDLL
ncbi:ABC transporter ATP-binding protein [Microbulbifer bruguierae]|uniref:ABC transporter ATP-binding protein n=1 Tax=Microbulbifer bruguierae TaxID=3029061 RepID=A0ABY8NK62_9GAMM|nr:ABC transporter ATP-binding protein [Microbulbifer bruguierae]WGL18457.1 ABC transporter ATP-binding protein [Microbulbifer bruguierae]